jgi:trigger factor
MRVTTERLENCQINVYIEMDAADVETRLRETARKISRQYNVPGYRRGKAPYHAVLRAFGREAVQQQALDDFGQELYDKALEQIEYKPFEMGELKEVEWDPFRMTVLLPVQPEVDLGDYRAVCVPFEPKPVTDEDVQERLKELQQRNSQWVPVERPAALGDQVMLDVEAQVGDIRILSQEEYEMRLDAESRVPLPGFHQEILGISPGEEKTFTLAVPEDYHQADAAGQEANVAVHVHTVREQDSPELDDELAKMIGDYDSLESLKTAIRSNLEAEALEEAESQYVNKVLDAMIAAAVKIEYPPQAVDREVDVALSQMERNLSASGIEFDTFLKMIGRTREAYKQQMRPSAEEGLRKRLVLKEVARREGLEAEPEEVQADINSIIESAGPEAERMREMLETPEGRESVAADLVLEAAQKRVIEIGKGEAPPVAAEEVKAEIPAEVPAEAPMEAEAKVEALAVEETVAEEQPAAEPPAEKQETSGEPGTEGAE